MHQQAILTTANDALGVEGDPVSIGVVEKHFNTSAKANAAAKFKCADSICNAKVSAVITKLSKKSRKNSPSSYFRGKHRKGCTRQPRPTVSPPVSTVVSESASPTRTDAPAIWVEPTVNRETKGTRGSGGGLFGPAGAGGSGKRSPNGTGVSEGRTQLVETLALKWMALSANVQRSHKLLADWNPGGNYFSAFGVLSYRNVGNVLDIARKIFVGMVAHVGDSHGVYTLNLSEINTDRVGLALKIEPQAFKYGRTGKALEEKLGKLATTTLSEPVPVFALGQFVRDAGTSHVLQVEHPSLIYLDWKNPRTAKR